MKKYILTVLISIATFCSYAQSYEGFLTDNYSGVHGVISNPANIADSRFKTDVNLIGFSTFLGNDLFRVNTFEVLGEFLDNGLEDYDFENKAESLFTDNNNIAFNIDVLGPSFMMNIDDKNSIALFSRIRGFINVNEVNGTTYDVLDNSVDDNLSINEGNIYATGNAWAEFGATYAREIYTNKEHYVKGGLSLKYLSGIASGFAFGNDLNFERTDTSVSASGEFSYTVFDDEVEDFEFSAGSGFGFDIGAVYEWRPDYSTYQSVNNKGEETFLKDENKYKLKLGLSITDIGSIKYNNGQEESYSLNLNSNDFDDIDDLDNFDSEIYTLSTRPSSYSISLPTALHINADYNVYNDFYLNLNTDLSLVSRSKEAVNTISNMVSLTPRYEIKWFSFYVPLNVTQYNGFQAGAGLRAGPLYIGSGSILSVLASDKSKGVDLYAGLKVPIYQGRAKDKDGDGIIDKLDPCPKIAGPKENNGCPWEDMDGDGVMDNEDKCPKEAGLKENNGCPIIDSDGDGIVDKYDECPEEVGAEENNGCPVKDMDKDGIPDETDKCPEIAGLKENEGCPDTDGDGVFDNVDKCPKIKGEITHEGCPKPKVIAPIKKEKLKELQAFARAIYFNSGRSTFKPGVRAKLDIIADIMNEFPKASFNIEGHTDSQGAAATNKSLSEKRAKAVVTYLITKSVAANRLSSIGYGEDYPISENDTKDGRALNRRVEIKLLK